MPLLSRDFAGSPNAGRGGVPGGELSKGFRGGGGIGGPPLVSDPSVRGRDTFGSPGSSILQTRGWFEEWVHLGPKWIGSTNMDIIAAPILADAPQTAAKIILKSRWTTSGEQVSYLPSLELGKHSSLNARIGSRSGVPQRGRSSGPSDFSNQDCFSSPSLADKAVAIALMLAA
jgi:hypothetical protein